MQTGVAQHDRVLERNAFDQAARLQRFRFAHESERPGRCELVAESVRKNVERAELPANQGVIELDGCRDTVIGVRHRNIRSARGPVRGDALLDLDRARRSALLGYAYPAYDIEEGLKADRKSVV